MKKISKNQKTIRYIYQNSYSSDLKKDDQLKSYNPQKPHNLYNPHNTYNPLNPHNTNNPQNPTNMKVHSNGNLINGTKSWLDDHSCLATRLYEQNNKLLINKELWIK